MQSAKCDEIRIRVSNAVNATSHATRFACSSLGKFVEIERLDGDNKYDAGEIHEKQDAEMFRKISACPKVLNIHLKRFGFNFNTMTHSKISSVLNYPVELDLSPYCDEGRGATYQLYSVIIHNGTVDSGHYFSYLRPHLSSYAPNSTKEEWFCANDDTVMRCDRSEMKVRSSASLLPFLCRF